MRVTRIIASIGQLGHSDLQIPLVRHLMYESIVTQRLPNVDENTLLYWLDAVNDGDEKGALYEMFFDMMASPEKYIDEEDIDEHDDDFNNDLNDANDARNDTNNANDAPNYENSANEVANDKNNSNDVSNHINDGNDAPNVVNDATTQGEKEPEKNSVGSDASHNITVKGKGEGVQEKGEGVHEKGEGVKEKCEVTLAIEEDTAVLDNNDKVEDKDELKPSIDKLRNNVGLEEECESDL